MTKIAKRIMALDPGTKRIGVALSDEMGWTAQPLETYERRTIEADIAHICNLVRQHEVRELVIGLPLRLNGEVGQAAQEARAFMSALQPHLNVPIIEWDERLTTSSAEALLIEADVSRRKRKGAVDRIAAALILRSYLDSHAAGAAPAVFTHEQSG